VGHVTGHAVTSRATAAVPPLAAAAALAVGLGVLKRVVQAHHAVTPAPAISAPVAPEPVTVTTPLGPVSTPDMAIAEGGHESGQDGGHVRPEKRTPVRPRKRSRGGQRNGRPSVNAQAGDAAKAAEAFTIKAANPDWTQDQIAGEMGVSARTVRRYLNGHEAGQQSGQEAAREAGPAVATDPDMPGS
jgi:hypothetical protein